MNRTFEILFRSPFVMPAATPYALRQRIWAKAQQGLSVQSIASSLDVPVRTVYRLLAQFRKAGQPTDPAYRHCGRSLSTTSAAVFAHVLAFRKDHPRWGAARISRELATLFGESDLPDLRTIRRWLRRAGLAPRRTRRPPSPFTRATRPHQILQMDAAEKKSLRCGLLVCWLRLVDEATGAVLFSWVFPYPRWSDVPPLLVQAALRRAFARWGRPEGIRVDNGHPWVSPDSDLPSDLELWLAGLDIVLYRNKPGRPQENGCVERSQRTASDWAEPWKYDTAEQFQQRLDHEDWVQREDYKFDGKQTRMQAYPDLRHSGRVYALGSWEDVCWLLSPALRCLAECEVERKVYKDGYVSLYDHQHRVGKDLVGQTVKVRLDAQTQEWVIEQEEKLSMDADKQRWVVQQQAKEVARCAAEYLSEERIRGLRLRRRQGRSAQQTQKRRAKRQQRPLRGGEPTAASGN